MRLILRGAEHSVIPPYTLSKSDFPSGLHLELTQGWSSQGFSLPALCPAALRANRDDQLQDQTLPILLPSAMEIYLPAKTTPIPAQRKLMRTMHCSRIYHRPHTPQDESRAETREPNFPFALCKLNIRKTA